MHPTAQASQTIRQKLKKLHGITSRQVSVRIKTYTLGSSIYITINDPAVDIREVQNVANKHERVDYDQFTGEILCGGNTHLFVGYSDAAAEIYAKQNAMALATLMLNIHDREDGPQVELEGRTFYIENDGRDLTLRTTGMSKSGWIPDASRLTPALLARSILAMREG